MIFACRMHYRKYCTVVATIQRVSFFCFFLYCEFSESGHQPGCNLTNNGVSVSRSFSVQ